MEDNKALSSTHCDSDVEFSSSPFCPLVEHQFLSHGLFFMSQGKKANKNETAAQLDVFSAGSTNTLQDTLRSRLWTDLDRPAPTSARGVRGHAANRLILHAVLSLRTYRKHDEDRQVQTAVTVRPTRTSLVDHNQ